jgi:hypothetical protein
MRARHLSTLLALAIAVPAMAAAQSSRRTATALPTAQQMRQAQEVREELPNAVADVNALLARLPGVWAELAQAGIYPAPPKTVK